MFTFNDLLRFEGVDPTQVRLARHQDNRIAPGRLHEAWRAKDGTFDAYQSVQARGLFDVGDLLASFIVTGARKTVFVGLYGVEGVGKAPEGTVDPLTEIDVSGRYLYDLTLDDRLWEYMDKLVIDWGAGVRTWVQRASSKPKPVIEFTPQHEPEFPGFRQFVRSIDEIPTLPSGWQEVLRNVKGIYLLVDVESGKQYVGSAKGDERLFGRWLDYANGSDGGDVALREAGPRKYQVSVLDVFGESTTDTMIEQVESHLTSPLELVQFACGD